MGPRVVAVKVDVTRSQELRSILASVVGDGPAMDETRRVRGMPLRLVVSNVGWLCCDRPGDGPLGGNSTEEWHRAWDINVASHVTVYQATRDALKRSADAEAGSAGFVLTASAAGLLTMVGAHVYAVTKAAAVSLAQQIAIVDGDWLRVTVSCPQAVATAMAKDASPLAAAASAFDGTVEAADVVAAAYASLGDRTFFSFPHQKVRRYLGQKHADIDAWIVAMRRAQRGLSKAVVGRSKL
jgi:NAD(P)-dependent dehydrogenase (short-subunit alcohol dehydrogenase family)